MGVWTGATAAPAGFLGNGSADHTGTANSVQIGAKLHLAVVTVDLTADPLIPNQIYAYNLVLQGAGDTDLSSEGLLQDAGPVADPTHLALGYLAGLLPSFALPPVELDRLQVVHGSCRKIHGHGPDGLAALDALIARTRSEPFTRPHQLFLTGDQIYADEVAMMLLPLLTEAGDALLGVTEKLPMTGSVSHDATKENFPTTWRQELLRQVARFTSGSASSHVLSFGEFCALYLFSWSNVLWGDLATKDAVFPNAEDAQPDAVIATLQPHLQGLYPPDRRKGAVEAHNDLRKSYDQQFDDVKVFRQALPKVRRALANVPTYMIFDDHEVTDDWYITQDWRDRVLGAPLGVTVLRNALVSYTLFQDWGNEPSRFTSGAHAQFLTLVPQLFGGGQVPAQAVANQIDALLGLDGTVPDMRWHYTVPTGPTTTVVLDTRTRRSFAGRFDPPGLISAAALDEQLPATLAPSPGGEVIIVVSPAPVLGLALIEELAQPLAARAKADFINSVVLEGEPRITGYLEWDMEAWAMHPARFEALLARCFEMGKVVVLSGDVHYAYSAEMDYWKQGQPMPARIVQLTASALKNDWGANPKRALETVKAQQLMQSVFYPASRLGWDSPLDLVGRVNVPGGAVPRGLRALLRGTPAVIPIEGWPAGTTISVPPEWAWRTSLVQDVRPDGTVVGSRPADGQIGAISPDLDPNNAVSGYVAVLQRGEQQLKAKIARSVVFASQFGLVTFKHTGTALSVEHALMYVHPAGQKPADPQAYTLHRTGLVSTGDDPPSIA